MRADYASNSHAPNYGGGVPLTGVPNQWMPNPKPGFTKEFLVSLTHPGLSRLLP
jgi:hypothetical protein